MSIIYILHFDEPLHHARHYIGVSSEQRLEARLKAHANGHGANLTKVLHTLGIGWRVGGLIKTEGHPRLDEAHLKQIKHTSRYCELCTKTPKRLRGTTPISIEELTIKTRSSELKGTPR